MLTMDWYLITHLTQIECTKSWSRKKQRSAPATRKDATLDEGYSRRALKKGRELQRLQLLQSLVCGFQGIEVELGFESEVIDVC